MSARSSSSVAPDFRFVGGSLCLDFLNTVVAGVDLLTDFASFVRWLAGTGLLPATEVREVTEHWGSAPRAAAALAEVKAVREVLRTAIDAFSAGKKVPATTLKRINQQLARSSARAELVESSDGHVSKRFRLRWREVAELLVPIVESAADLLTGADHALVRQCAGEACTLFFHDHTKNHRRRWCSVSACGNRAKVAAFRARQSHGAAG